ncbi:UDP-N-acetylmuramate dehydrogenase [Demequina globuliformis]|uniref:UDP-N-acetylmuramate dehydrogenase n=1 Tax=Demequina globuliformis TaxID=676202 RepID=UPI0007806874|nr:UDP-N-acetylmuramate dehydrogenase [Demequina globuliformis]
MTVALADFTTLRVGGPASTLVDAASEDELIATVSDADAAGTPLLVLGGGSNLLIGDGGFDGVVLRDARREVRVQDDGMCGGVSATATAGLPWDSFVEQACAEGWVGIEALSGIPGSTGATPVQNVGAYGAEVADTIATVRVWDRAESRVRSLPQVACGFAYRDSLLKKSMRGQAPDGEIWRPSPRYIVLDVTFHMRFGTLSAPIRYAQLAAALGVAEGDRAPLTEVREAVLEVRARKGMVLDSADHDTWSAGSFFTNPILSAAAAAALPADAPRFPTADGRVKTSAAWLIERAGFARGFQVRPDAPASLSTKHTLALTNRGAARADDLVELAKTVQGGVADAFAVDLVPEPVRVGVDL